MYIVIVAWIYVVFMMSVTEKNAVAGIMTFLLYGVVPVGIMFYLMRSRHRKHRRLAQERQRQQDLHLNDLQPDAMQANNLPPQDLKAQEVQALK